MKIKKLLSSLGLFFLLIGQTIFSFAEASPETIFTESLNKTWRTVYANESIAVLFKDNSEYKETIVLSHFEQSTNLEIRYDAYKNNLSKLTDARNKMLEIAGGGRQNIIAATPFNKIESKKIDGIFIESTFESMNKNKSQIFERQYFVGNKIFQVLYITQDLKVKPKYASSVLDSYLPKPNRLPASEAVKGVTLDTKPTDISSYREVDLSIPLIGIEKTVNAAKCTAVPVEKRRSLNSSVGDISATFFSSAAGCANGIFESIISALTELKNVVAGLYKYTADSIYREQLNASVSILWAEFTNNPQQFSKRLVTNVYNLAAQSGNDFICMNPVAQAETVCKLLPYAISGGYLLKIASRAKLTLSESKVFQNATALVKKSVLQGKNLVTGVADKNVLLARLSATSKPISWNNGDLIISRSLSEIKSSNPEIVSIALNDIKNTKLDLNSFKKVSPAVYNGKMLAVVDELSNFIRSPTTSDKLRKEAAEALAQYSKINSGNYRLGYLGRRTPEVISEVYYDPRLSDEVRKIIHAEMTLAYKSVADKKFPDFRTSASMLEEFNATGYVQGSRW